jgi:hypothetical protein
MIALAADSSAASQLHPSQSTYRMRAGSSSGHFRCKKSLETGYAGRHLMSALSGVADSSAAPTIAVGQRLPSVVLDSKPGPGKTKQIALAQYVAGKRIILLGLPGAFTAC